MIKVIDIPTDELFNTLSPKVLFEARWGFTKGNIPDDEYKAIIENKAKPELEKLINQEKKLRLIECKAIFGIFPCIAKENDIIVYEEDKRGLEKSVIFNFPRQEKEPRLCISDFISHDEIDKIAFFAVTIGNKIIEREKKLFEENSYYDYHLLHGLGAEMADCGAVCVHKRIGDELFTESASGKKSNGCRYSFGYPSCPELSDQKKLFELLNPDKIGLNLTQSYQMVPELSVSGFIIFNNKARYFVP